MNTAGMCSFEVFIAKEGEEVSVLVVVTDNDNPEVSLPMSLTPDQAESLGNAIVKVAQDARKGVETF